MLPLRLPVKRTETLKLPLTKPTVPQAATNNTEETQIPLSARIPNTNAADITKISSHYI
jgi:hypothetical protein